MHKIYFGQPPEPESTKAGKIAYTAYMLVMDFLCLVSIIGAVTACIWGMLT